MNKAHKNLIAWQKSINLVTAIYELTEKFPKSEVYGLTSQMRRAAVSIPSNIAEGASGRSKEQFKNYLSIAIGSLNELDTQLEIALRLNYLPKEIAASFNQQINECFALMTALKKSL